MPPKNNDDEIKNLNEFRLPLAVERVSDDEMRELVKNQPGALYELEGEIFYSPNCNRRVHRPTPWPKPEPDNIFNKDSMRLRLYQEPLWYHNHYRCLPYVPTHTQFHDWICAPLYVDLSIQQSFVKNEEGYWMLPPVTIERWDELRRHINWFMSWLFAYKPPRQRLIRDPAELGYRKSYKTWESAALQARRSRDWFVMLFASATWLLAEYGLLSDVGREETVLWKWLVTKGIDKSFLYAFLNSTVVNLGPSMPRAGCFMNVVGYSPDPEQTARQLNRFLVNGIPVWIPWNSQTRTYFNHPSLQKFQPSAGLVQSFEMTRARLPKPLSKPSIPARMPTNQHQRSSSSSSAYQGSSTVQHSSYNQPWSSPSYNQAESSNQASSSRHQASSSSSSAQLSGSAVAPVLKPWEAHFQKRAEIRARYLAKENAKQRQSRESRELFALKTHSKKSEVYRWEESSSGVRERKRVNKREVDELMGNYGANQKRYDSVSDEWDVCTEFGEWTEQDQDEWDEDEDEDDGLFDWGACREFHKQYPLDVPSDAPPVERYPDQARNPGNYTLPEIAVDDSPESPPPDNEIFFGWQHAAQLPGDMGKHLTPLFGVRFEMINEELTKPEGFGSKFVYKAFGGTGQPDFKEKKPIDLFLAVLFEALQPREIQKPIDDLKALDVAPLTPALKTSIRERLTVLPNDIYVISPPTLRRPAPRIVVYCPEAAVFACRLGEDLDDTILELYRYGIRFNVCHETSLAPRSQNGHLHPIVPLVYQKGTRSDRTVYEDYVRARKFFLVGYRRRAALLAGGLISRIAAGVIGSERECKRLVLQDPSPVAGFAFNNIVGRLPNGNWLYDDVLLPSEKDCILGTYFIAAKSHDRYGQTYDIMCWWPRYSLLESNRFDIYSWFWDPFNEEFYRTRSAGFLNGPLPATKKPKGWADISKIAEPLRRVQESYMHLCLRAISESWR